LLSTCGVDHLPDEFSSGPVFALADEWPPDVEWLLDVDPPDPDPHPTNARGVRQATTVNAARLRQARNIGWGALDPLRGLATLDGIVQAQAEVGGP
jgi:hypothetical protein